MQRSRPLRGRLSCYNNLTAGGSEAPGSWEKIETHAGTAVPSLLKEASPQGLLMCCNNPTPQAGKTLYTN
ncbi:MAG: hypothetical protein ACLVDF_12125 [Acutalibacteraceae bacterium]